MFRNKHIILLVCFLAMSVQAQNDYRSSLYQRLSQALQAGKKDWNLFPAPCEGNAKSVFGRLIKQCKSGIPLRGNAGPGSGPSGERYPFRSNTGERDYLDTSDSPSERSPDTDRAYDQRDWSPSDQRDWSPSRGGNSPDTGRSTDDEEWWDRNRDSSGSNRDYDEREWGERFQRGTGSDRNSQLMEMLQRFGGGNGDKSSGGNRNSQLMEMLQRFGGGSGEKSSGAERNSQQSRGGNSQKSTGGDRNSQLMEMLQQLEGGDSERSSGGDRNTQLMEMLQQFGGGNSQRSSGGDRNSQLMQILNRFGGGDDERSRDPKERNWRRAYARNSQSSRDDDQDGVDFMDRLSPFSSGRQSGNNRNTGFKNFLDRVISMVGMESHLRKFMQPSGFMRF
ncbi:hypothetical protein Btru_074485 [Bulinus truncatus]|nr:hypothetical protein Btru_074485 [Bulinus truncatus]